MSDFENKVVVLVEVVEGDISVIRFPNITEAKEAMLKAFLDTANRSWACDDILSEEEARAILFEDADAWEIEDVGLGAMAAEVYDGPNHDNYLWKIEEI